MRGGSMGKQRGGGQKRGGSQKKGGGQAGGQTVQMPTRPPKKSALNPSIKRTEPAVKRRFGFKQTNTNLKQNKNKQPDLPQKAKNQQQVFSRSGANNKRGRARKNPIDVSKIQPAIVEIALEVHEKKLEEKKIEKKKLEKKVDNVWKNPAKVLEQQQ